MVKHAAGWALAVAAGRSALILEDDITIADLPRVVKLAQQRKHDCVLLGSGTAYLVTAATADKLLRYFARVRRPAAIRTELPAALEAMCLTIATHEDAAVDESDAGTRIPSATAGKKHPGAAALTTLDAARDLYEATGHPDVALKYVQLLNVRGYAIKAHDVCRETFERVASMPDGAGSAPFVHAFVELFKGAPTSLRSFTSSW